MRVILFISLLIISGDAINAQPAYIRKGNRLYKEKKFTEALPEYQKAAEENPSDPVISFNLGDVYFRNQQFDEAEKSFDRTLAKDDDPSLRQRAFYNEGVSFSKQSKLQESIAAYKSALLLTPSDNDARINLQKALLELKKKQDAEKDKKQEDKNQQKKQNNPPPSESTLNKKQAEQLLRALDQHEQQVQQRMMQNRTRGVTKPDKDW